MNKKTISIQRVKKLIKKLNPIDDIIFRKMAESREFCEEILRVFLQDPELKVLENHSQYSLTSIQGRSVILDACCVLKDGKRVNVEVQNQDNTDHERRVRYYSSVLTTSLMEKGADFDKVPDVCMVYICNFDIFSQNKSLYSVKRVIDGSDIQLDNGLKEIYISANINDGSVLSELMEVFTKDGSYNEKFPITSQMKHQFKNMQEGETMTGTYREIYGELIKEVEKIEVEKAREEGIEVGIEVGKKAGIEVGRKAGIEVGRKAGIETGRKAGIEMGIMTTLVSLVKDGLLNVREAAVRANISVESFEKLLKE